MAEVAMNVSRHELLWIGPDVWREALHHQLPELDLPILETWAEKGWPVIVRRRFKDDPEDAVSIGVPLPPSMGKQRIALHVPRSGVVRRRCFVPLLEAMDDAPRQWKTLLNRILALGDEVGACPALFGSLLWQHLTGLEYLSPGSDVDLLWWFDDVAQVDHLLQCLSLLEKETGGEPRIDGELLFSSGAGVNWRELFNALNGGEEQVLIKSLQNVQLVSAKALLGKG